MRNDIRVSNVACSSKELREHQKWVKLMRAMTIKLKEVTQRRLRVCRLSGQGPSDVSDTTGNQSNLQADRYIIKVSVIIDR